MKKVVAFLAAVVMLGLPLSPAFAAETLESCLTDPPINPVREGACGALIYQADTLPLSAEVCGPIFAMVCPPYLPCVILKYLTVKCGEAGYNAARTATCTEGPRGNGCCISTTESPKIAVGDGTCTNEVEDCKEGGNVTYSCCVCETTQPGGGRALRKVADARQTRTSCEELCKKEGNATMYLQAGAGSLPPPPPSVNEPTAAELQEKLATCFTQADCASKDYGGSTDAFRPGHGCPSGQGWCIAPEPEVNLSVAFGNVKTVKGLRNYIASAFNYGISIVAIVAAVMFTYGGFRYIFGSAFQNVKRGKEIMIDAVIGLVLVLGAVTILQTINQDTLNLTRLEVHLINKSQILSSKFCSDITSTKLKFAEAGPRPAYTPINKITSYPIENAADTRCNYEYYAEGFGGSRCAGRKCDNKGESCVSCRAKGACKEGADPLSYECVKANWSGTIAHVDQRYVDEIALLAVCNNARQAGDMQAFFQKGPVNNGIDEVTKGKITANTDNNGTQSYTFEMTEKDLQDAKNECSDKGGLAGFVMAIEYQDTDLGPTEDDEAIVGKSNCGGGKFSGYVNGTGVTQYEAAVTCGLAVPSKPLANPSNYWSVSDLETSLGIGGDAKPVTCDMQLSNLNAPSDPGSKSTPSIIFSINGGSNITCGIP